MSKVFYRKKFSDYLGEQRAIDDIVMFFEPDPSPTPSPVTPTPTPTPSITPTRTLTPTPTITRTPTTTPTNTQTPSVTPTNTATPTVTPTVTPTIGLTPTQTPTKTLTPSPTGTNNPLCPQQFVISNSTNQFSVANGTYNRLTIKNPNISFDACYMTGVPPFAAITLGAAPDGKQYASFGYTNGIDYFQYVWNSTVGRWGLQATTVNYLVNGGVQQGAYFPTSDVTSLFDGTIYYPTSGQKGTTVGYYLSYSITCPTPTPTPTPSITPSVTPTLTPSPTPVFYSLLAENTDFILAENGDNINIQN
jgi:hypothetical protein